LNQLVNSDKDRHRYKDKEEHENSRHQQKQGRRQPLERGENQVYHLTTHLQDNTHKAKQQKDAEHKVYQQLYRKRERIKEVTAKGEEAANIRKDKNQVRYQSHTLPSVPAPVSK